jgi:hypothetical protein
MATSHMVRDVSPIPPGRYWICVLGSEKQRDFDLWIRDMRGAVQVETSSMNEETPSTEFVIFRVPEGRYPFLDASWFGFPNTAPPEITSLQDVEQSPPPPPDPLSQAGSWFPKFDLDPQTALLVVLALVLMLRK